jgi:hypothetical protein
LILLDLGFESTSPSLHFEGLRYDNAPRFGHVNRMRVRLFPPR